jgi:hypothetical protein
MAGRVARVKPVEFEGQNLMLNPPDGMQRGTCGALPSYRHGQQIMSVWKPSPADIEALKAGAHVCLTVLGHTHPPVAMHVQKMVELP